MVFILIIFIIQTYGCMYGCNECNSVECISCDEGYQLTNGICISIEYIKEPTNNYLCSSGICVLDYSQSNQTEIELTSHITSLLLPSHEIVVSIHDGDINSVISGDFIIFSTSVHINSIHLPLSTLHSQKGLNVNVVECNSIFLEEESTIRTLKSNSIELNYHSMNKHNINIVIVDFNTTIKIHVNEDQKKIIEKHGVYFLENTKFISSNNTNNISDLISLNLIVGEEEVVLPYYFITNLCNNRTSAFLPEIPEDFKTSCPDYIFVKPTTSLWWVSATIFIFFIICVFIFGIFFTLLISIFYLIGQTNISSLPFQMNSIKALKV
ncbi:hypothetical protein EDI_317890 [Entamoeba dispar SAW760]|uniref:Uncharacterized protein n=1 Tax=Entamoeba dispar (strain ATCC PRA-260 / SAW760) TaxID=370354 RepID=B0EIB2_ENTDS|nr:uncharacterized protein EDI_317890 [Entamoeba dispar SAW760]EDR25728.1 hypothetical protein EDI_317890 [Entamoeba dispar SAW760]|eukprot:EDR25728.1 hypothetical protein EDI_317890 [Entamoeba dispar SAW760]